MTLSKTLRFEVLKRDGFRCRYCGVTAVASALEVDHVVPRSKGGVDSPENLVAACFDCNRGKSDVSLEERKLLPAEDPIGKALEHADQIREYLMAQEIVEAERARIVDWLDDKWRQVVNDDPPLTLHKRWRSLAATNELSHLVEAMEAVASASYRIRGGASGQAKYFSACLRNIAGGER